MNTAGIHLFEAGQRLRFIDPPNHDLATILKVKNDRGTLASSREPVYVLETDHGQRFEVAASHINHGQWSIIAGTKMLPETLRKLQIQYQIDWINKKTEQARERMEQAGLPPEGPVVAFYKPGELFYGERSKRPDETDKPSMQQSVKAIKQELEHKYPDVEFQVKYHKNKVSVTWTDGPVYIPRATLDPFICSDTNPDSQVRSVFTKREISDDLVQSAISFVQCVYRIEHTAQANRLVNANLYRTGVLQTVFIPHASPTGLDLCYQDLVRLTLMRWDEQAYRFIGEGVTRHLRVENDALFGAFHGHMEDASQIMRDIRQIAIAQKMRQELEDANVQTEAEF